LEFHLERGIPSNRDSLYRIDYVPAFCTHRPSLLPMEQKGEFDGLELWLGEIN